MEKATAAFPKAGAVPSHSPAVFLGSAAPGHPPRHKVIPNLRALTEPSLTETWELRAAECSLLAGLPCGVKWTHMWAKSRGLKGKW